MNLLAITALSAAWQAVLYGIATVLFLVAAFVGVVRAAPEQRAWPDLVALGLALAAFVLFWNALALS